MNEKPKPLEAYHMIIALAAVVVVVAGMRAAASIVVPFLLAVFLAILCGPPLTWLGRRGMPRSLAMTIVLVGIGVLAVGVVTVIGGMVNRFATEWPTTYHPRAVALAEQWNRQLAGAADEYPWLNQFQITDVGQLWTQWLAPDRAITHFTSAMRTLTGTLGSVFFIVVTTIFLLAEATLLPNKIRAISSNSDQELANLERVTTEINRYMGIKTWTSLLTGFAAMLGLFLLGVDFAILWGLLAFLLNFVPNIGSIIAAAPAILWALVQRGFGTAFLVVILYLVINTLIGTVLEPRWMGRSLGLSTLVVFLSLVFWGWVLGPVGMVISVPLTMTIKIAMESHDDTRWLAILMGGGTD